MKKIHLFYAINFLSAFLLFQIELIISKLFLPQFGGSYLAWGACMVFFQSTLLLGYFYAHFVVQSFGMRRYHAYQIVLMAFTLLVFPGKALPSIIPHAHMPLVADIFIQLFYCIGFVFFILSTMSIITQSWLVASELEGAHSPYLLYAISNFGSFAALLSYPVIFELYLNLDTQLNIWRIGYLALAILYFFAYGVIKITEKLKIVHSFPTKNIFEKEIPLQDINRGAHWLLLAMAGSMMLLSVTNTITYEITPCPILWVIPLSIYLATFVLAFREQSSCPAWVKDNLHLIIGFGMLSFFLIQRNFFPKILSLGAYLVFLFAVCMICHYTLYQSRPHDKKHLTSFYLAVALGGALGSFLVIWIIPFFFAFNAVELEYPVTLLVVSLCMIINEKKEKIRIMDLRWVIYVVTMIYFWPLVFKNYHFFGIVFIFFVFAVSYRGIKDKMRLIALSVFVVLLLEPLIESRWQGDKAIFVNRNYYGIYKVVEKNGVIFLHNGTTLHGAQFLDPAKAATPLTYYHANSAMYQLLRSNDFKFKQLGVVGLGAGVMASFGDKIGNIDFYELDPDALFIADSIFSYVTKSLARINYYFGDARISLRKNKEKKYDILIIDAFSGDSVPVHLLTTEAIMEYKSHLTDKGIILFHTSNRYLDIISVLFNNAEAIKAYARYNHNSDKGNLFLASSWVTLTWDKGTDALLTSKLGWKGKGDGIKVRNIKPWTDGYSSVLPVFRFGWLLRDLKSFTPFNW